MSAGSKPTAQVHPRSLELLNREGISREGCYSKSWYNLRPCPDIVITVCPSAAGETYPVYLGSVMRAHWGVADPVHVEGTDEEITAVFVIAYRTLRNRTEAFLALLLEDLTHDSNKLQQKL